MYQQEERAARSSLARLGLTQSPTGAGAALSQLAAGAAQRSFARSMDVARFGLGQRQQTGGILSSIFGTGFGAQQGMAGARLQGLSGIAGLTSQIGEARARGTEQRAESMFRQRGGETPTFGEVALGFAGQSLSSLSDAGQFLMGMGGMGGAGGGAGGGGFGATSGGYGGYGRYNV